MIEYVVHQEVEVSRKAAERYALLAAAAERTATAKREHRERRVVGRVRAAIANVAR